MQEVSKGVQAITKKHGGANFEFSKTDAEAGALWQGRKAALWSVLALREGARVWTTDVWCVSNSRSCIVVLIRRPVFRFRNYRD
jgi:D-lactate dehydrogenase (cytochrome)